MAERTSTADKDTPPVRDSIRQELNKLVADVYYWIRNHMGTVSGALAIGTTKPKVQLAAAITYLCAGACTAKAITDDLWTLTGGNLATGSIRKYRLLLSTAGAATVQASSDAATAAGCDFATRPADGKTIVGILTITNGSGADFVPGTTDLDAAGITAAFTNGTDALEMLASIVSP